MFALAVIVALLATAGLATSAQAANYTVGTHEDLTGTCPNPNSDTCSLRQLIEYEDSLPPRKEAADAIVVPAGQYSLSNGPLQITQTLVIVGAGARTTNVGVPAGIPAQRVFEVMPPPTVGAEAPTVVIQGLEISGGTANQELGLLNGGDIYNSASLLLNEDWVTGGSASAGGGIANEGGTLLVEHSLVSGNHANSGGGEGGGIQNYGTAFCHSLCEPLQKAVLVLEDSTVAGNDARWGAGIYSLAQGSEPPDENQVSIINSTVAYNRNQEEPCTECFARGPGAGLLVRDGTAFVTGSILAHNTETTAVAGEVPSNCSTEPPVSTKMFGTITSLGYNIETGTDCGFTAAGDQQETEPEFSSEAPQNNGGNTDTLSLRPSSPAIDAIPTSYPFCTAVDQRGVARPQGAGCDIGAVELVPLTIQATEGSQFSGQVATSPSGGVFPRVATINWGDGQTSAGTVTEAGINGSHTYAEEGTYTGTVTYSNRSGAHKVAFLANVADAPLTAAGVPVSATAGAQFSATVATFTDADPAGTALDYTAAINWGDGSNSAGTVSPVPGGFAVTGSHTYAAGGTYSTSVTIDDVGGATATATSNANVANPPPPPPAAPTLLTTAPPSVLTTTSAVFTATVNPNGLPTTVHFEYGGTFGGATVAAITYGTSTPNQSVPADFASHTVTATVTGLLPNVTYHVRAVAANSLGTVQGPDQLLQDPGRPPATAAGAGQDGEHRAGVGDRVHRAAAWSDAGVVRARAAANRGLRGPDEGPLVHPPDGGAADPVRVDPGSEQGRGEDHDGDDGLAEGQGAVRQLRRGDLQAAAGAQAARVDGIERDRQSQRPPGLREHRQGQEGLDRLAREQQGAGPPVSQLARPLHGPRPVQRGDGARNDLERAEPLRRNAYPRRARHPRSARLPQAQDGHAVHRPELPGTRARQARLSTGRNGQPFTAEANAGDTRDPWVGRPAAWTRGHPQARRLTRQPSSLLRAGGSRAEPGPGSRREIRRARRSSRAAREASRDSIHSRRAGCAA